MHSISQLLHLISPRDVETFQWLPPLAIFAALVEGLILTYLFKKNFDWKACAASMGCKAGQTVTFALTFAVHAPLFTWAQDHHLMNITIASESKLHTLVLALTLFLGLEFCYYWLHRASHEVRFFWAHHTSHHTPNQLNLSASMRGGWFAKINGIQLFYLPLIWIGFHPTAVFAMVGLSLFYQFCLHVTWIPKLGFFEYVFNSPSLHRVHHARNENYLNANYGSTLIIYDLLFGTYKPERKDLPCEYGLVDRLNSYNPFVLELYEWGNLFRDLRHARNLREVFHFILGKPGKALQTKNLSDKLEELQRPDQKGPWVVVRDGSRI